MLVTLSGDSAKIPPAMGHALKRAKRHLELNSNSFIELNALLFESSNCHRSPPNEINVHLFSLEQCLQLPTTVVAIVAVAVMDR